MKVTDVLVLNTAQLYNGSYKNGTSVNLLDCHSSKQTDSTT